MFAHFSIFLWLCENRFHIFFTQFEFILPIAKANKFRFLFCSLCSHDARFAHRSLRLPLSSVCFDWSWFSFDFQQSTENWVCESMSVSVFICLMSYFKRCRTVTVFAWMNLWDCVCAWCCAQYGSNILFGTYEILCSSLWFLFRFSLSLCERQYIICRSGYHLIGVSNGVVCFANRVHYIIMVCERKSPSQPYFGRLFSVSLAQLYHAVQCSMFNVHVQRFSQQKTNNFRWECSPLNYEHCITPL